MNDEYDFSKGERGKFFREGARLNVPVYLDDEVGEYLQERAQAKGLEVGRLVNDLLRREIEIIESVKWSRPLRPPGAPESNQPVDGSGTPSASNSASRSATTSKPPCQKAGSAASMPTSARISRGRAEPPWASRRR